MRWTLILLPSVLLCSGFAGCSSHTEKQEPAGYSISVDLKPPVISGHFTLLPCPAKPKTTLDFVGCAQHRIVRSDKAINERVRVIFSVLSASAQRRFVRSERAWLAYRRAICESRADVYEGGSAAGIVFAKCVADRNLAHLKDLRTFERDLKRGRS